ncbi:sulfotransferase [Thermodesulfobacteriota bacterium]
MKKPNLFMVGHPRSGTSSLHYYLNQHPDIFMTSIKEPNYFVLDFRKASDLFHSKQLYFPFRTEVQYLRLYRKWAHQKIAGEASATSLCSKVYAREIHRFNPKAKIIMIFREPVEFLYSFHSAAQFALGEHHKDFERDQIKIIIFDDFKKDTLGRYQEIPDFLNVDAAFTPKLDVVNPNKQIKWLLFKKYTLDAPYFRKTLSLLFSHEIYAGMKNFYKEKIVKHKPRPKLDEDVRTKWMIKFKPEVEKISSLMNIDLITSWGYDKI